MITFIRREISYLLDVAPNEAIITRLREAEQELLKDINEVNHFVEVLCESIELKDVKLSILALQSLKKLLESNLVISLKHITDTVTKTEFSSIEPELVEEGYYWAICVCSTLIKCKPNLLTNGSTSEIIIFCFRVVNSKLGKWLRDKAARTLMRLTRLLFNKLNEYPEDPYLKPSYQIRLRLGGTSSQSTFKELADQFVASDTNSLIRIITERNEPFNLAVINDYYCYLASLINPEEIKEDKLLLGLKLLKVAITESGSSIGQKACLTYITRYNVVYNIVTMLKMNRSTPVIRKALNLGIDIFLTLRYRLKFQFEAFLELLIETLATNGDNTSPEPIHLKAHALIAISELFMNINNLSHELYYNFDCSPFSSNIYENLVQMCSKNCFQQSPIQRASFDCLLANLADIYFVETGLTKFLVLNDPNSSKETINTFPKTYKEVNESKKRKRLLWLALEKFNARPKDGIQFIKDNKLIDNNEVLVQFLKDNPRADKKVLGEYLSKPDNKPLRESFIRSLDFQNLRIDEALRLMLEKFRLPGESQLIERILDSFSMHWFEQNPGILNNSDSALSLAYAIIMLNVDQHSKKVKPMTRDEFDRNLLAPNSERIYDKNMLHQIYTNIRDNEIVLPDEQAGSIRQRYLWKCTMVKSERIEAQYWIATNEPQQTTYQPEFQTMLPLIEINEVMFEIMWNPTLAALSFIFDTSSFLELSHQIVDEGFIRIAHLCARYSHLDNLIVSLCKFTTDLNPIPQRNLMSDKNSLAAVCLLSIIREHGNSIKDSWANIIRNILHWYCSKCVDDVVLVDDFALNKKLYLRMREIKKSPNTMNQQSSTFLRSVYTYFAGESNNNVNNSNNNNISNNNTNNNSNNSKDQSPETSPHCENPSAIQVLIQTIQDGEYKRQESLVKLITALSTTTLDGDPEEVEDAEIFKLEIFTQIVLNNKEQALAIWPKVRAYFARLSSICGRSSWFGERIISAAFRVAIQFHPKPEVFNLIGHLISTLDAEIVREEYTFTALTSLSELRSPVVSLNAKELEECFNHIMFPFLEKILDGCDPLQIERTLNKAINLLSKIFLKHYKLLKDLPTFASLWYAILDIMDKYIKVNNGLKEFTFESVKNMVLVMDNEKCMSVEMKDFTRTKFMFWEYQSASDY